MARILITGSTDGLGRAAAIALLDRGHDVVLHARSKDRARAVEELGGSVAGVVVGDLRSAAETRSVAEQVNSIGRMDAVMHNAGVYLRPDRDPTADGHATTVAVNTLAPYLLTALIEPPTRLAYLSSGLHRGGEGPIDDIDWTRRRWDGARAYAETKLHVVALAGAIARCWPTVVTSAVDPGWVRTRMGGPSAPVDLRTGAATQSWLAVDDDPDALVSGGYWHAMRRERPAAQAIDTAFQDELVERLAGITGIALP